MGDPRLTKYADDPALNGIRGDGTKIKVMIVEDSLTIRRLLKVILEETNYEVLEEIENGKIAVEKYQSLNPDIVTMDITMPELEGDQAVQVIKKIDPDARILMISALSHKTKIELCMKNGAKGYILKPITQKQIPKILEKIKQVAK